jgi:PAS domain-containing protein
MDEDAVTQTWVEVDPSGCYLDAGPEALEAFGVTRDELRRHRVGDFAPAGLGPIHLALFLWVVRQGNDFGGGSSTIVGKDGRVTRVRCTAIEPAGEQWVVRLTPEQGDAVPPSTDAVAAVLDAWRRAERDIEAHAREEPAFALAMEAARSLRGVYQFVVREKTALLERVEQA